MCRHGDKTQWMNSAGGFAVNFDVLWYWTHCDNILLARAVKHLPTGCWTSDCYILTHHDCHTSSSGHSMQKAKCVRDYMAEKRNRTVLHIHQGAWVFLLLQINVMQPAHIEVFVCESRGRPINHSFKLRVTATWISMTDGWTESSQVWARINLDLELFITFIHHF